MGRPRSYRVSRKHIVPPALSIVFLKDRKIVHSTRLSSFVALWGINISVYEGHGDACKLIY